MIFGKKKKQEQKACCFTGHRPQGLPFGYDEQQDSALHLKEVLRGEIERQITENGVTHFISGMALGTDLIAAELVLELKKKYSDITLESAIPCEDQASRWSVAQRERYYNVAARCDKETMLQRAYTKDCFQKRNQYMVDNSAVVIAVWNGHPSGTGQTVMYAHARNKPIIIINPFTLEVTR
jgi:uncharacterized phage-like protein YoqJ